MVRQTKKQIVTALALAAACLGLGACETRISANATSNAPVQYSHVFVTIEQVWVNTSADAGPDDTTWLKQTLDDPQTIDLVGFTNGSLKEFASQLPIPPGTYNQVRLILSDTNASLLDSAQTAGAKFNNEVDYFDTSGTTTAVQAALAVPNPTVGVTVPIKLVVQTSSKAILGALGSANSSTTLNSNTNTCTDTSFGCTPSSTSTSTTTTTTTTDTTSTDSKGLGTTTANAAVVFDAGRDVARFSFSGSVGFTLNARLAGYDLNNVGTIRSQLGFSALTTDTNTARFDVQVTAETLSKDGSRNVPVLSAPLRNDGTFILFPFPMDDDSPTTYDLVIHGPGIQTIIVKSVPVQSGTPTSAPTVNLNGIELAVPASNYPVNVSTATPVATRGARVGFYQTLNGSNEVPYLIEERTIDPVSGTFAVDQIVPSANIAFGTFNSGSTLTLSNITPVEGIGAYKLGVSAALYGDGAFGDTLVAPAAGTATTTTFNGPTVAVPTGVLSGTLNATVNITTPGRYDRGVLVISHDGAIVTTTSLDTLLSQASGSATVGSLPAGDGTTAFPAGTYSAEAWTWLSTDPDGTFVRQPAAGLIDLRAATTAAATVTVN
jgi:mucin-6/19